MQDVSQIVAAALASGKYEYADKDAGGNFPPMHDFDADPILEGTYKGVREIEIKGKARKIHVFETPAGTVEAWGCYVLDADLPVHQGKDVLVAYEGMRSTKSGNRAKAFTILAAV